MGGSSGGGGDYSTGPSRAERDAMEQQKAMLNQQAQYGSQIGAIGNSQDVNQLAGGQLTNAENQQLNAIDVGQQRAVQGIEQNVREQSSARGLYSSARAIGQEAAGLANLDVQRSQNIADIYGNAQQRQFQGIAQKSGLLGQAGGVYGQVAGGYGNLGGSYQNSRQISNQGQQMQNQYYQQQQQQQAGNIMNVGRLIAAPFTGGSSLAGGF